MKKIQVTTVEQTAQVQVINLNSYLVAKSVRVMLSLKHAIEGTRAEDSVTMRASETAGDDGKFTYRYNLNKFTVESIDVLHDEVLPFLEELCNAFEETE